MQFNQAALLRRAIGLQADEFQSRRHDFRQIRRIAVELEHDFRAGREGSAGVKSGGHDELIEALK